MTVYLLWCNDWLMKIFTSQEKALKAAQEFIDVDESGYEWKQTRPNKWVQPFGSVARLEVEAREVIL